MSDTNERSGMDYLIDQHTPPADGLVSMGRIKAKSYEGHFKLVHIKRETVLVQMYSRRRIFRFLL